VLTPTIVDDKVTSLGVEPLISEKKENALVALVNFYVIHITKTLPIGDFTFLYFRDLIDNVTSYLN